jgi:hypothetical protein
MKGVCFDVLTKGAWQDVKQRACCDVSKQGDGMMCSERASDVLSSGTVTGVMCTQDAWIMLSERVFEVTCSERAAGVMYSESLSGMMCSETEPGEICSEWWPGISLEKAPDVMCSDKVPGVRY